MADPTPRDLTCREVVELVTDYLEGALSPAEAADFEHHLRLCDGCDRYVDQIRKTIGSVGHVEQETLPAEMRARLLAAFRDWKNSG